jgi:hypothetical protein
MCRDQKRWQAQELKTSLILAWIVLVIGAYYVFHKPINEHQVVGWLNDLGQIVTGGALVFLAGGVGRSVYSGRIIPGQKYLILQVALGLGLLGTGLLGWGVLIGYQRWSLRALFMVLLLVFARRSFAWVKELGRTTRTREGITGINIWLAAAVLVFLGAALVRALAPPLKFDALVYHLSLPDRYLEINRFAYLEDNVYWGMPQLQEMFFVLSMAVAGVEAAPVFGWWIGLIGLWSVYLLVEQELGRTPAWIAVLTLISGLTTAQSLSWGYNFWFNILWGGAFLAAFLAREEVFDQQDSGSGDGQNDELGLLVIAGLVSGFALGTKYTSGLLLIMGLVGLLREGRRFPRKTVLKRLVVFFSFTSLAFSPWLLKNWIGTGNPVYPFFLSGGAMDAWRQTIFVDPGGGLSLWKAIGLPLVFSILGVEGGPGYAASMGPLLLALGAIGFLSSSGNNQCKRNKTALVKFVLGAGLLTWGVAGLFSVHLSQTRLFAVVLPAGAALSGIGFWKLSDYKIRSFRLRPVVLGLIMLVVGLNMVQVLEQDARAGTFRHLVRIMSDDEYLADNLGWYAPAVNHAVELIDGGRVLMLWEPRGFYCLPVCDSDEILDRWHDELRKQGSGPDVAEHWVKEGYSHILIYRAGADFLRRTDDKFTEESWDKLDRLLESLPLVEDYGGIYQLYRLGAP